MIQKTSNFYFYTTLIQPKINFKLVNFFLWKKKKSRSFSTSFWKSYSWFSHVISSNFWIRISTLKKIKNKILLKNFILTLFSTENWISFSDTDIKDSTNRNLSSIWKNLKKISIVTENIEFSVFSTNKIFNKIFKNFLFLFLNSNWKNPTVFLEKYFFNEKYTRALGLSNNLKFFFMKFFLFYLPSTFNLKKLCFFNRQKTFNFYLKKLNNFIQLFLNKWYFIFINNKLKLIQFKTILNQFLTNFNLIDNLIFFQGNIFNKSNQNSLSTNNYNNLIRISDSNFINFFFKINKANFLAFMLVQTAYQFITIPTKNLIPLFFNDFILTKINCKIFLIKIFNFLIKLKLKSFFFLLFFKKIIFYWCQLLNN